MKKIQKHREVEEFSIQKLNAHLPIRLQFVNEDNYYELELNGPHDILLLRVELQKIPRLLIGVPNSIYEKYGKAAYSQLSKNTPYLDFIPGAQSSTEERWLGLRSLEGIVANQEYESLAQDIRKLDELVRGLWD